jgi:hypothetical protein
MATPRHDVVPIRRPVATAITRTTPLPELPEMLTVDEVRAWLGLGRDAAYQWSAEHGRRIGRLWTVPRRVLEEMTK